MSNFPRNRSRLARRPAGLGPRPRILVFCEGEITEPSFFNDFRRQEQNRLVDVIVDDQGGAPKTLVERAATVKKAAEREARRQKDDFLKYDEVWCVYDVDAHPNLPAALQQARANNISLAISNPCFELWLLLHFQDQRAHLRRDQARAACRKHMPRYEKLAPFELLYPHYEEAIARAIALDKWQREQGRPDENPSTGVHRLTERIRQLGRNPALRRIIEGKK